jgi:hypothetical protein
VSTLPGAAEPAAEGSVAGGGTSSVALLRPETYECANCGGRFEARNRPTPYCTLQCGAEAKTVRYARKARAEHGDDLPESVRTALHRQFVHALTECAWDKWSGEPEPGPVTPPEVDPLAGRADAMIPDSDVFARRANGMKVRVLSADVLRPCDVQEWDSVWREWVNAHAR